MAAAKRGRPNWARGLNASTNESIARNAASRLGRKRGPYVRTPSSRLYPLGQVEWTEELAYAVGLIATDGCLTGRTITFTSTDRQLVETFMACVGQTVKVGVQFRPRRLPAYRAQLGNQILFNWLISIGITQRKSLTIGAIDVPDEFVLPLARGLLVTWPRQYPAQTAAFHAKQ